MAARLLPCSFLFVGVATRFVATVDAFQATAKGNLLPPPIPAIYDVSFAQSPTIIGSLTNILHMKHHNYHTCPAEAKGPCNTRLLCIISGERYWTVATKPKNDWDLWDKCILAKKPLLPLFSAGLRKH